MSGNIEFKIEKVLNLEKAIVGFKKLPSVFLDSVFEDLFSIGQDIRTKMIESMRNTPRDGETYTRDGKKHVASSPGNPPASDTGELLRSLLVQESRSGVEVGATIQAPYAPFLEEGTMTGEKVKVGDINVDVFKISPRPFLEPALNSVIGGVENELMNGIVQAAKKTFR